MIFFLSPKSDRRYCVLFLGLFISRESEAKPTKQSQPTQPASLQAWHAKPAERPAHARTRTRTP